MGRPLLHHALQMRRVVLLILYIGASAEPFGHLSLFISNGQGGHLEPMVLAMPVAEAVFEEEIFASRLSGFANFPHVSLVVWMDRLGPASAQLLSERNAGVLQPLRTQVIALA